MCIDEMIQRNIRVIRGEEKGCIENDFYEYLKDKFKRKTFSVQSSEKFQDRDEDSGSVVPQGAGDDMESLHEFYFKLVTGNISGSIRSSSDMHREIERFLAESRSPERKKLWDKLSEALLSLEKKGAVSRNPKFKGYNNSNSTPWSLKGNEGKTADEANYLEKQAEIGIFTPVKRSANSSRKPDIIPLSSAEKLISSILKILGGEVHMSRICELAKNHVVFLRTESLQQDLGNGSDDAQTIEDRIPSPESEDEMGIFIGDEVLARGEMAWKKILSVKRKGIQGEKIFCLYLIPKDIQGKRIRQSQFGADATVSMVYKDILGILKEELCVERRTTGRPESTRLIESIQKKTISYLNSKCSEIGMDTGL